MAAVASFVAESERCPQCGLNDDAGWHVKAVVDECATCHDMQDRTDEVRKSERNGKVVRWRTTVAHDSSAAWHTPEGALFRMNHRSGGGD